MSIFTDIVEFLNHYVWAVPESLPWLIVLLLSAGIIVTIRLRGIQLFRVRHAFRVVAGKYDDPDHEGDISHFAALSTALSATVGIGNIAGVAVAIHLGGPGAIFWMWVTAFFGMALKYAECTMSMLYRDFDDEGNAAGGPMYYIEKGLGRKWKPLAIFFAGCTVVASFGGGNMNQSNTVAVSARADFGFNEVIVGIVTAILVGAVILGGIKRIGQVSSRLAPTMAAIYVAAALLVLGTHLGEIPSAFATIIGDAFNPSASVGGSVAGAWMTTLVWGIKRGLFSNEAGQGSAPIAHAAAKTDEPVREGVVAMLGPLIDTLIICTMTALVIIVTNVWDQKHPSEMRVSRVDIVPASAVQAGDTEFAKVSAALAAAATLADEKAPDISLVVRDGSQTVLAFVANDALMEAPVLVDEQGMPLNATLRYSPADGTLTAEDGGSMALLVRGKALLTSSALTAMAFKHGLDFFGGGWGNYIVTFSVFLFALSTMISWSYYGDRAVTYLFGHKYVFYYRLIYVFFVFIGAWAGLRVVWDYGDLALGLMTVPNLIAVIMLSPRVVASTKDYFDRMKAAGIE